MRGARRGEGGQSLVEAALALPALLLLALGSLQFAFLLWQRVLLQHAVHCAARAYTVWQAEDSGRALDKARRAAWLALRGTAQAQQLHLHVLPLAATGMHALELQGRWRPLPGLSFFHSSFSLSARCGILNESPHGTEQASP